MFNFMLDYPSSHPEMLSYFEGKSSWNVFSCCTCCRTDCFYVVNQFVPEVQEVEFIQDGWFIFGPCDS